MDSSDRPQTRVIDAEHGIGADLDALSFPPLRAPYGAVFLASDHGRELSTAPGSGRAVVGELLAAVIEHKRQEPGAREEAWAQVSSRMLELVPKEDVDHWLGTFSVTSKLQDAELRFIEEMVRAGVGFEMRPPKFPFHVAHYKPLSDDLERAGVEEFTRAAAELASNLNMASDALQSVGNRLDAIAPEVRP